MNKALKYLFNITFERPGLKTWRGVKVPFIIRIRKHHEQGSYVYKTIIGPDLKVWSKEQNNKEVS